MRTKFLIIVAAIAAVAIPSGVAVAEKFNTRITVHVNDDQDMIFGVVRSREIACEKGREVRLYGPPRKTIVEPLKGGQEEFVRYAITTTNRFGEYKFRGFNENDTKRGVNGDGRLFFPDGDYFTRAIRKDFPGDVCRRSPNSEIVSIDTND